MVTLQALNHILKRAFLSKETGKPIFDTVLEWFVCQICDFAIQIEGHIWITLEREIFGNASSHNITKEFVDFWIVLFQLDQGLFLTLQKLCRTISFVVVSAAAWTGFIPRFGIWAFVLIDAIQELDRFLKIGASIGFFHFAYHATLKVKESFGLRDYRIFVVAL